MFSGGNNITCTQIEHAKKFKVFLFQTFPHEEISLDFVHECAFCKKNCFTGKSYRGA